MTCCCTRAGAEAFDARGRADKSQYDEYYELVLQLLRPGGVLVLDNVLWKGAVLQVEPADAMTAAIQQLNAKVYCDERVDLCMLSNSDGITVALKR